MGVEVVSYKHGNIYWPLSAGLMDNDSYMGSIIIITIITIIVMTLLMPISLLLYYYYRVWTVLIKCKWSIQYPPALKDENKKKWLPSLEVMK